jgi:hypothetical protein
MSGERLDQFEARVRAVARDFPYPATPDIARAVRQQLATPVTRLTPRRQLGWAVALIVVALLAALSVPQVRAALIEFIQIGAVRLNLIPPTPTPPPPTPTGTRGPTAVPTPLPTPLASVLNLRGETTLADARQKANFTVLLPGYPPDLGEPDHVFVQEQAVPIVVLVWLDPNDPTRVQMSLHEIGPGSWALDKMGITKEGIRKEGLAQAGLDLIQFTRVHGQVAAWVEGPHLLITRNGDIDQKRLVTGNTLIWQESGITYRLESELTIEEAVKVAESLK